MFWTGFAWHKKRFKLCWGSTEWERVMLLDLKYEKHLIELTKRGAKNNDWTWQKQVQKPMIEHA